MILHVHASYPPTHAYVVKLHRDCDPRQGRIVGRLEHIASGRSVQFASAEDLIACLIGDAILANDSNGSAP
jgi:hypothetical protein